MAHSEMRAKAVKQEGKKVRVAGGRGCQGRVDRERAREGQPCRVWCTLTLCVVGTIGEFQAER